jgi:peptide deformylase
MIRPVFRYGDKILHQESQELLADVSSVQELIDSMADSMYAAQGVELAAPQIGVPLRVLLAAPSIGRDSNGLTVLLS